MHAARLNPAMLARLGRLDIVARTVVHGFLSGVHRSPYRGASVEFAEHRQYYPGDDIRDIDWQAFGKTDRFYVKQHEHHTNAAVHLVVDASGSMAYAGRGVPKYTYARFAAAALAYLLLRQRDAVGLAVHDAGFRNLVRARNHPKQLFRLTQCLENVAPSGESPLGELWDRLARRIASRGLVILLSDCFGDIEPIRSAWQHLKHRRHDVIVFQILAPEEIDFPFRGPLKFHDLERSANERSLDAGRLAQEYRARFAEHSRSLARAASELAIDFHPLRTDAELDRALAEVLRRRRLSL